MEGSYDDLYNLGPIDDEEYGADDDEEQCFFPEEVKDICIKAGYGSLQQNPKTKLKGMRSSSNLGQNGTYLVYLIFMNDSSNEICHLSAENLGVEGDRILPLTEADAVEELEDIKGDPEALTQEDCERPRRCGNKYDKYKERGCPELSLR